MKLFSLCCITILLVTCASTPLGPPKLPSSATFGWKLESVIQLKPDAAPETVRKSGFAKSWRATYKGPGDAQVDIYRLNSQSAGLEITQHWRASAQTVTIFNSSYFVIITWQGANRAAATALVGQIERSLPHSD